MAWIQISTDSKALHMQVDYQALIPQQGDTDKHGRVTPPGPYPTLYLLHGHGGDSTEFLRNTSVERYVSAKPLAVVFPNAHNSWWRNLQNGMRYFDYVTDELTEKSEEWFPLSRERGNRYIGGISMGGYGALHAALTLPERYAKVVALSPAVKPFDYLKERDADRAELVFGALPQHGENGTDLFSLADRLAESGKPCPEIYLACGRQDPFFEAAGSFCAHLEALGLPVTFAPADGAHDWEYGDHSIRAALKWLFAGMEG